MKLIGALLVLFFSVTAIGQEKLPAVNQSIIDYVDKHKDQKILRGECWDLVSAALNDVGAAWDSPLGFGKKIEQSKIKPGDIIEFKNVAFKGELYSMSFPQHYAIVYKVNDDGTIMIAHQNHANVRKVRIDKLILADKTKGSLIFYRPQKK